jgi:K+-transporting ATPase A subunit
MLLAPATGVIVPVLAIAGSLARKKLVPAGAGHPADPHAAVRRRC